MKLVKMSLAAAVLLGASAFAVDNVKVSGDAKVFYSTNNAGTAANNSLFDQSTSAADTALRIGVTGDLTKGVSFGATGYAVSTLGLENNLVSNTWTGAHSAGNGTTTSGVQDTAWMGEAWVAATLGKTTAKLGRMELDTPLAFSEKWSIVPNTFDAAVVLNQDIPDTTLVGAWVGKGNGANALGFNGRGLGGVDNNTSVGIDGGVVGSNAAFNTFMQAGAYAVAAINNSFKPLVAQVWYYNVASIADAYWLQADINCQLVKGVKIGAQYADLNPKGKLATVRDTKAYAFKLGYEGIENLKVSGAYSKVNEDGTFKVANVATDNTRAAQSKLYTEAWWNYGYVGAPDAASYNLAAEYDVKGIAKLGAYYTNVNIDNPNSQVATKTTGTDLNEIAVTATKSFGPLDTTLAYVSTNANDQNNGKQYDTIQAYLTLNF